jgi:hypothetical protein
MPGSGHLLSGRPGVRIKPGNIVNPAWKIVEIKTGRLFLVLVLGLSTAIVVGITGCVADQKASYFRHSPTSATPTWSGDNHTPPVYTSPATTPATTNLPATNTPP